MRPVNGLAMKETAGRDISVGSPDLASQAMAAALVDEMHLVLITVTDGDAPRPPDHLRSNLGLLGWTAS
jgi:dihydrofolate reductase